MKKSYCNEEFNVRHQLLAFDVFFLWLRTAIPTGSYIPLAMRREAENIGIAKITLVRKFFVHSIIYQSDFADFSYE